MPPVANRRQSDSVVDLEQQATAAVDEVKTVQETGIVTNATFTNTASDK